jgi:hypothetical protein
VTGIVHVTLRFVGDGVDPQLVTAMLRLQPTRSGRTGESETRGKLGRSYRVRANFWLLDSQLAPGTPLGPQLSELMDALQAANGDLAQLIGRGYEPEFFCSVLTEHPDVSFAIQPRVLERIGQANIRLRLDLYPPADDSASCGPGDQ